MNDNGAYNTTPKGTEKLIMNTMKNAKAAVRNIMSLNRNVDLILDILRLSLMHFTTVINVK